MIKNKRRFKQLKLPQNDSGGGGGARGPANAPGIVPYIPPAAFDAVTQWARLKRQQNEKGLRSFHPLPGSLCRQRRKNNRLHFAAAASLHEFFAGAISEGDSARCPSACHFMSGHMAQLCQPPAHHHPHQYTRVQLNGDRKKLLL